MDEAARKFISITQEFVPPEQTKQFFIRLDQEIEADGSLKEFMGMTRRIVDPPPPPVSWWVKPAFYVLIMAHMAVVITMPLAFCALPFKTPWYIAVPLMAFIWFFSSTSVACRCTDAENVLRQKLGKKRIGGFVGHYFYKPMRILMKKYGVA